MSEKKEFIFNKYLPHFLIAMLSVIAVVQNIQLFTKLEWYYVLLNFLFIYFVLMTVWFVNTYFSTAKYYQIFIVNTLTILVITIIVKFIYNPNLLTTFPIRIVVISFLFVAIQQSLRLRKQKETLLVENLQLKSEAYKAELENLKSQLNPHFLFNSLTTLQALIRKDKEMAETFVIKLSEFYRVATQNSMLQEASLESEIELMYAYFYLMQIRFEEGFKYSVNIDSNHLSGLIPSFTLQQIIENCFKHNSVSPEKPLCISVYQKDEHSISISNNIQPKITEGVSSGKGLENLSRRYKLMGVEEGVVTKQEGGVFEVTLKLI